MGHVRIFMHKFNEISRMTSAEEFIFQNADADFAKEDIVRNAYI